MLPDGEGSEETGAEAEAGPGAGAGAGAAGRVDTGLEMGRLGSDLEGGGERRVLSGETGVRRGAEEASKGFRSSSSK